MSGAFQVVVGLLAMLASSLSVSTVTKTDLEKGTVPFRVEVSPEVKGGLITVKLIYDDRNHERARRTREGGFPPRMHLELKSLSAQFLLHADNGNLVGSVAVAPELALEGELVVFVGTGLIDHAYTIPLELFADEIRNAKRVDGNARPISAKVLTKEDFEKPEFPFSIRKARRQVGQQFSIFIKYNLDGLHPNDVFKNSPHKDRVVQMTLYVDRRESDTRVAVIPLELRTVRVFEASEVYGDVDVTSEYAAKSRILVTMKDSSEEHSFMIPLGLFVESKAD